MAKRFGTLLILAIAMVGTGGAHAAPHIVTDGGLERGAGYFETSSTGNIISIGYTTTDTAGATGPSSPAVSNSLESNDGYLQVCNGWEACILSTSVSPSSTAYPLDPALLGGPRAFQFIVTASSVPGCVGTLATVTFTATGVAGYYSGIASYIDPTDPSTHIDLQSQGILSRYAAITNGTLISCLGTSHFGGLPKNVGYLFNIVGGTISQS